MSSSSVFSLSLFLSLFLFLFFMVGEGAKAFFLVYDFYLTTGY